MSTPSPSERRVSDEKVRAFLMAEREPGTVPEMQEHCRAIRMLALDLQAERALSEKRRQWIAERCPQWDGSVWFCLECGGRWAVSAPQRHSPECSVPSLTTETPE